MSFSKNWEALSLVLEWEEARPEKGGGFYREAEQNSGGRPWVPLGPPLRAPNRESTTGLMRVCCLASSGPGGSAFVGHSGRQRGRAGKEGLGEAAP